MYLEPFPVLGLGIAADGSLSPLSSSPELAPNGRMAISSKAPSVFVLQFIVGNNGMQGLDALIVNPDYSLSSYTSTNLGGLADSFDTVTVDPTGQNLYLSGPPGLLVLTADGAFKTVQKLATSSPMVFTPDGKFGFAGVCTNNLPPTGDILSFARAENGTLTQVGSVPPDSCVGLMAVSPDGRYLATGESDSSGEVGIQVYSISPSGTLTAVLSQPFQVTIGHGALVVSVHDLTWDASNTYLLVATGDRRGGGELVGGLAVLNFSGSALTETVEPSEGPMLNVVRTNSFVYAMEGYCFGSCSYGPIVGYSFGNGQLTPLPGSPYSAAGQMVIY